MIVCEFFLRIVQIEKCRRGKKPVNELYSLPLSLGGDQVWLSELGNNNDYILLYKHQWNTGELSCENLISSHVKITRYLEMWKYHHCYGYILNGAFHTKKLLKRNGLVFHWCLYGKYNITWPLGDTKFLFLCWKEISYLCAAM